MHTRWEPLRTTHVDFDSNSVETCRQPACHAEGDVHGRHKLCGRAAEIGANGGEGFEVAVVSQARAGWVLVHECSCVADDIEDFGAALDCPEVVGGGYDLGCGYHDNAEGDNGGELGRGQCQLVVEGSWMICPYVEPRPKYPCSVLIDLQHLDVVDGESKADGGQDEQSANPRLCCECSAKGFASDHNSSNVSN
jgi:hypothetical protein